MDDKRLRRRLSFSEKVVRVLNMKITILILRIRLDRIAEAQREAARVRADVEMAFRALRMQEDQSRDVLQATSQERYADMRDRLFDQLMQSAGADTLRRSTIELTSLSETIGKPLTVAKATEQYTSKVTSLLGCINENVDLKESCSDKHDDLVSLAKLVVNAYGQRADEHLTEHQ
jgi:hypothetical protein